MLDLHGINKAFILQWNYENTAIHIINCAFELIMSKFATLHCQSLVWNCSPLYLQQSMVLNYQGHCDILVYINLHSVLVQEAQISPRDNAMCRVSWNLANCHTTVQKLLVQQVLNKLKLWSWRVTVEQCVINMCTQPWRDRVASIVL